MTVTLELSADAEERLRRRAMLAGIAIQELVETIVEDAALRDDEPTPTLLDEIKALGVLGAVTGTSGPGDGRGWSEIEAPCDPI
jgi:hypothetical protein